MFTKLLENKTIKTYDIDGLKVVKKFADSLEAQVESKNSVLLVRIYSGGIKADELSFG